MALRQLRRENNPRKLGEASLCRFLNSVFRMDLNTFTCGTPNQLKKMFSYIKIISLFRQACSQEFFNVGGGHFSLSVKFLA